MKDTLGDLVVEALLHGSLIDELKSRPGVIAAASPSPAGDFAATSGSTRPDPDVGEFQGWRSRAFSSPEAGPAQPARAAPAVLRPSATAAAAAAGVDPSDRLARRYDGIDSDEPEPLLLRGLRVSDGVLNPSFSPSRLLYLLVVPETHTALPRRTARWNPASCSSAGEPSKTLPKRARLSKWRQ